MNAGQAIRLGLAASSKVGPVTARSLRDRLGGWSALAAAARAGARQVPARVREDVKGAPRRAAEVAAACEQKGIGILFRGDVGWPRSLEILGDVPEVLFHRGRTRILHERGVAIVGARECSVAGADLARRLGGSLAAEGWTLVSGLARGIDGAAHAGALEAGGDTVAVLGCGPDIVYPPENRALMERIAREGLLLTEFAPGMPPVPGNFPRRNRLLSALAEAVVLVECRLRSGAMVTVRHALDQGKDVYVVPGWPTSPLAAGSLALLRDGARPLRGPEDLLEDLGGVAGDRPTLDEAEADLISALDRGARTPAELAAATGAPVAEARERLARLELMGLVGPGGRPDA